MRIRTIVIVVAAMLATGCGGTESPEPTNERVYATVNGVNMTESDLEALVPKDFYDRLTNEHKRQIIEEWVNDELLYQNALSQHIDREAEMQRLIQNSERKLLSNEFLERELAGIADPGEDELRAYYMEHQELFEVPTDEYRVRYALFDNRADAQQFYQRVKGNTSFSTLAQELSKDPSAANGGEIGIVNESMVEPNVWDNIVSTVQNRGLVKISDPFMVMDGWACIIADEEFESGTIRPFEDVRNQLLSLYLTEKRDELKEELLSQFTGDAEIQYYFP